MVHNHFLYAICRCEMPQLSLVKNQDVISAFVYGRNFYSLKCTTVIVVDGISTGRRLGSNQYNIEHYDVRSVSARFVCGPC